jgi:excisionase family DNA binding protein
VIADVATPPAGALLDTRAVAALLHTSVRTVERLAAAGELEPIRLGRRTVRFAAADVDSLIERRRNWQPAA